MENNQTLAERVAAELRAEMAWQGKSVSELSETLGVSVKTARARYAGSAELALDEIDCVSAWLQVDRKQLLTGIHGRERLAS